MADVTGRISSLPGAKHKLPEGAMCDMHEDRPAVVRIQGETDSFGSELVDMCQECYDAMLAAENTVREGGEWCEHCKGFVNEKTHATRDPEEGSAGPVYYLCAKHRRSMLASMDDDVRSNDTASAVDDAYSNYIQKLSDEEWKEFWADHDASFDDDPAADDQPFSFKTSGGESFSAASEELLDYEAFVELHKQPAASDSAEWADGLASWLKMSATEREQALQALRDELTAEHNAAMDEMHQQLNGVGS